MEHVILASYSLPPFFVVSVAFFGHLDRYLSFVLLGQLHNCICIIDKRVKVGLNCVGVSSANL